MDTSTLLAQGTKLRNNTYRIVKELASGGFGNTYLVSNDTFNEMFAMKEFFMKGVNMRDGNNVTVSVPDNHTTYESQKEKFKKEAKRLRGLNNNHIVKVHDLFDENSTVYYIMDYIDGESIAERLKNSNMPMSEQESWNILTQVLDALREVHNQSIWHLDIKPGNIMLDKKGNAYLIDFGASKQFNTSDNKTSSALCYTPGYAAVEQVEQALDKFGPWTDFYALGATLYYMQTLQQPPSSTAIAEGGAFKFPPTMSQQMRDLIVWMMKPARRERPQSVDQIVSYISMYGADGGNAGGNGGGTGDDTGGDTDDSGTVIHGGGSDREPRKKSMLWVYIASFFAAAIIGAGVFLLFFNKSPEQKAAEEAQDEYEELVEDCRSALEEADDFPALLKAKDTMEEIAELEEEHADALPKVYNKLDGLQDLYDEKCEEQKDEYIELIERAMEYDEYHIAYILAKEAHEGMPDDRELTNRYNTMCEKVGYIEITDIQFSNQDNGTVYQECGETLYASQMRYLYPKVVYNSLLPDGHDMVRDYFKYKIIDPDGTLDHSSSSPSGYTNKGDFLVAVGEVEQGEWLNGWGNSTQSTYEAGDYQFELYYDDHKVYETSFTLY